MGIIRNSIDITGITAENKLPKEIHGQVMEYSETENIFIEQNKPSIKNILRIALEIQIQSKRKINAPLGGIVIFDGIKKCRIIYEEKGHSQKSNILDLELPYNTFVELPKEVEDIASVTVYILDAYFELLDSRKLYSHIVYLVDVQYDYPKDESTSYEKNHDENSLEFSINNINSSDITVISEVEEQMLISKEMSTVDVQEKKDINTEALVDMDAEYL